MHMPRLPAELAVENLVASIETTIDLRLKSVKNLIAQRVASGTFTDTQKEERSQMLTLTNPLLLATAFAEFVRAGISTKFKSVGYPIYVFIASSAT